MPATGIAAQNPRPLQTGPANSWEPPASVPSVPVARDEARSVTDPAPTLAPAGSNPLPPHPVENTLLPVAASTNKNALITSAFTGSGTPFQGHSPLPPLQMVNARQVSIDYEVDNQGPSGVGKVELWMTPDDGKTWEKFTETTNVKPPLAIELRDDGVYGFRLVLQSKAGRQKPAPVSGDLPEMRLELDTISPAAELYQPEPDARLADGLVLKWTTTDRNLASNPITLQWTDQPAKEWQTIVADYPNDGHYTWRLPKNIPYLVYLRLVVRDTAGNTSTAETPKPVCIDLVKPEGHLKGIIRANPTPAVEADPPHRLDRPNDIKGTDLPLNLEHGRQ
jgi:hypothetical protein